MFFKNIIIKTYGTYYKNLDCQLEKQFEIPKKWLKVTVKDLYNQKLKDFLATYTWDISLEIYNKAKNDNVIVAEIEN